MLTKMLATLCRFPEICASVVVAEKCTLSKRCRRTNAGGCRSRRSRWPFCPTGLRARGGHKKFDANLLKLLPECLPELPALANVVIVVAPCRCAASATRCTSVLNQTPVGSKRKKKRKPTHQWPSVSKHHLVHTIRTQDESIQKKKRAICLGHIRTSQREQTLCVCCAQTLPPERSEARGYEPKWHFARHPARVVFFSGKRRQLGGKKNAGSQQIKCGCSGGTEELALFARSASCRSKCFDGQPSQRAASHTIFPMPWHATPSRDLGGVPPFHKMIDQATFCWSSSIAWDSEKEQRS